ncbi:hypothetical protein HDV00_000649 [Rhizophlyctis rosea]|nr:hypothetical protein HDV00_000649 [Rhizophlyctis rosea]
MDTTPTASKPLEKGTKPTKNPRKPRALQTSSVENGAPVIPTKPRPVNDIAPTQKPMTTTAPARTVAAPNPSLQDIFSRQFQKELAKVPKATFGTSRHQRQTSVEEWLVKPNEALSKHSKAGAVKVPHQLASTQKSRHHSQMNPSPQHNAHLSTRRGTVFHTPGSVPASNAVQSKGRKDVAPTPCDTTDLKCANEDDLKALRNKVLQLAALSAGTLPANLVRLPEAGKSDQEATWKVGDIKFRLEPVGNGLFPTTDVHKQNTIIGSYSISRVELFLTGSTKMTIRSEPSAYANAHSTLPTSKQDPSLTSHDQYLGPALFAWLFVRGALHLDSWEAIIEQGDFSLAPGAEDWEVLCVMSDGRFQDDEVQTYEKEDVPGQAVGLAAGSPVNKQKTKAFKSKKPMSKHRAEWLADLRVEAGTFNSEPLVKTEEKPAQFMSLIPFLRNIIDPLLAFMKSRKQHHCPYCGNRYLNTTAVQSHMTKTHATKISRSFSTAATEQNNKKRDNPTNLTDSWWFSDVDEVVECREESQSRRKR